jgi:hypothetical protein
MTFSKGKTWALQDLRVVEVHNVRRRRRLWAKIGENGTITSRG